MSAPAFSSTLNVMSGLLPATADTSFTAPTNITSLVVGGSLGTQVYEMVFEGVGTTVAGLINVFLWNGTTYFLFDSILVTAVTPSTTVQPWRAARRYTNLFVKNGSTLRIAGTVAGNQSLISVTATAGDIIA